MPRRSRNPRAQKSSDLNSSLWGTVRSLSILLVVLSFALGNLVLYPIFSQMGGYGFRYVVLAPLILIALVVLTARFIRKAYHLKQFKQALQYLIAALTATGYPRIQIIDGKKKLAEDEENLMEIVGGPGNLIVQPGNVVLLENLNGKHRVLKAGRQFVGRSETIKAIQSLDEQSAKIEDTFALTRDGFDVIVKDGGYRYRLLRDLSNASSTITDERYAFSDQTVLNMAYNRTQIAEGIAEWHKGINTTVVSGITDYIADHTIDELTSPLWHGIDPRMEINKRILDGDKVQNGLRARGGELLWIDIGHFDVGKVEVDNQRVSTWQARWISDASITRASADARRRANQEAGYAEAQAEILMSIVQAFEDFQQQGSSPEFIRSIYLARFAQLLDSMGKQYLLPDDSKPEKS